MLRYALSSLLLVTGLAVLPEQAQAEPVEYVRVCDAYGAGWWYIPGTETCIKFGGYVRFDFARGRFSGSDTFARTGGGNTDSSYFTQSDTSAGVSVGARAYVPLSKSSRVFVGAETAPTGEQEFKGRAVYQLNDFVNIRVVYDPNRFTAYTGAETDLFELGNGTVSVAGFGGIRYVNGRFFLSGQAGAGTDFSTNRSVTKAVPVLGTEIRWQWSPPRSVDPATLYNDYFFSVGIQYQGGVDETLSVSTPNAVITDKFEVEDGWSGSLLLGINF